MASLWLAWIVSWHVAALWRGKSERTESPRAFGLHVVIAMVGFVLVFSAFPRNQPMLWPVSDGLGWAMVALTVASFAFAWWARIHLGRLWSGGVVLREDHKVVDSGPYALVRHPIYAGLFAAVVAMAVVRPTPLALVGAPLFVLGFTLKARVEERFIEQALPDYGDYRRRVGMIVPWLGR
jgi:protein-S-isoprenylcysteine O-methyltransferase Ste14